MQPNNPSQPIQPVAPPRTSGNQPVPQNQAPLKKQQRPAPKPANQNSTQNSLLIAEIRDGIAIMQDGSFRSVVLAKSINFDLMSQQEQEAVEYAYQGFINSLYFDLQIVIKSRKIDMRPYLEKLQSIHKNLDNMLLGMLMEDYIYFIDDLVADSNIMSKQFYLVVPYYPPATSKQALETSKKLFGSVFEKKSPVVTINQVDLEKAKTELKNRVSAVLDGLQQMGVQGAPLDTQELIELYYNTYNPDTATRQTLKDLSPLNTPVVTKGKGSMGRPYTQGSPQ
jgi:hypothetical protein